MPELLSRTTAFLVPGTGARRPREPETEGRSRPVVFVRLALAALASLSLVACASPVDEPGDDLYRATLRRTRAGIPHVVADDAGSLGFATLYAMAQDNVCILADQYLTLGARRSRSLGPGDGNLERDFFHQLLIDRGDAEEALPMELEALFRGAADGYNHYLAETGVESLPDPRCRGAAWVEPVTPLDVKRVSRMDYALAYMMPLLVGAAPPKDGEALLPPAAPEQLVAAVSRLRETPKEGGSNAVAIGRLEAEGGGALLLANPHMPWNEPFQRFYPLHQTLRGRFDAIGANLIGRPRVGFGHNHDVAWTSTVSTAKRMTFYRLELVPGDPTRYLYDGTPRSMKKEIVEVPVRTDSGAISTRRHVFYTTHFGAALVENDHFQWTSEHAFAVRMPDVGWRGERPAFAQLAARSVRELKAIHDRHQFLTVNLIAADRSGEVLYGDLGPIPNLTDEQRKGCAVLGGAALDGSRSDCQWRDDPDAAAPGIIGPARLPSLIRSDFVTNSNDSHWLPNPAAPLEGFPSIIGDEGSARTLRTRSGLKMVLDRTRDAGDDEDEEAGGRVGLEELQALALSNESMAGQLIRDDVVAMCRATPIVQLPDVGRVDLSEACTVLEGWDLRADLESRGAHLFRELLAEANGPTYQRRLPNAFVPAIAFDPKDPLGTPAGLDRERNPEVLPSLARAVLRLQHAGIPLDAPLGDLQGVSRGKQRIPLHGGPESEGIFNKIEARFQGADGYPDVTRWSSSWILAVELAESGLRSRGILTYSLSANPESPHHADQTWMFSRKQWLDLPFFESDVEAATLGRTELVVPRAE